MAPVLAASPRKVAAQPANRIRCPHCGQLFAGVEVDFRGGHVWLLCPGTVEDAATGRRFRCNLHLFVLPWESPRGRMLAIVTAMTQQERRKLSAMLEDHHEAKEPA
jgi:hypothetical protein